jgi:hypothetical protein
MLAQAGTFEGAGFVLDALPDFVFLPVFYVFQISIWRRSGRSHLASSFMRGQS